MSHPTSEAWVVVDLGFGDAGKGAVVDQLCRERGADLVVRFNGGAQAGHNVVAPDGRHHTFAQFGAGTLAGVPTLLGPAFLLHPLGWWVEAEHLQALGVPDPWSGVAVDRRARVISPYHQAANRVRERLRGAAAHGTCGVGVGACVEDTLAFPEDALTAGDLDDDGAIPSRLARQRERLRASLVAAGAEPADLATFDDDGLIDRVRTAWRDVAARLRRTDEAATAAAVGSARRVVLEGAQGVLLDETWGFHPHTTWSDCTPRGALALLGDRPRSVLGLTRAYQVRHGAGPFPTEGTLAVPEPHNGGAGWQGPFRTGALDGVLLRYAAAVAGALDAVVVTCLDRVDPIPPVAVAYAGEPAPLEPGPAGDLAWREALGRRLRSVTPVLERRDPVAFVEEVTGRPVALTRHGPTASDARWRGPHRPPSA